MFYCPVLAFRFCFRILYLVCYFKYCGDFMALTIAYKKIKELIPYCNNSRTHSDEQVLQIASSIKEFGFTNPVLIDDQGGIIAGHGRIMAAQKLKMEEVPTITLSDLSEAQKKAYIIADNKLALNSGWDDELLKIELEQLKELDFDLGLIGFDEIELGNMFLDGEDLTEPDSSTKEIDTDEYEMSCICPKCGFEFDDK